MRRALLLPVLALAIQTAACDWLADSATEPDAAGPSLHLHPSAGWGNAMSVDPGGTRGLNTRALEGCPNESPDGRALYFASDRDGQIDIWVSKRDDNGDLGTPEKLPAPVNSSANDFCPTALPGGALLFVSTRSDGANCGTGTSDLYETRLHPTLGWLEPRHLGCELNSAGNEFSPAQVDAGGGMLFFSSDRAGKHALYVSLRASDGTWQAPTPVDELNLAGFNTVRPNVSQDGRDIVFDSDRPNGIGGFDVWYSHRATPWDEWAAPTNAGAGVNSEFSETRASLSRDGQRLYFGSNRPDYEGNSDIFVSRRH